MVAFKSVLKLLFVAVLLGCFAARFVDAKSEDDEEATNSVRAGDEEFHKFRKRHYKKVKAGSSYTTVPLLVDEDKHYWRNLGQSELRKQLQLQPIIKKAKNVILFLGDGMSIATVTAARILKGQRTGEWEHEELVFEDFPYTALLKTYTTDSQVADSAASATAYLCGVKANLGTIGVDNNVEKENCSAQHNANYHTTSILRWFQDAGRSSGFVTNMRVTHATPAGAYAHIADREWEDDHEVSGDGLDSTNCDDIAEQLVMGETGRKLKVIMGGGRRNLQPRESRDVEEGRKGYRRDGKDLIKAWEADKRNKGVSHAYVWNKDQLLNLTSTDYLLGLFAWSHMDYLLDREHQQDPSLEQMTRAAIQVLEKDPQGYFLLIEGGLIDHGHHGNKARKALTETLEMDTAVQTALDMTDPRETLIVVTADHSHSMTLNGYPGRHTDILGFADLSNVDYLPYHTLLYGNGPGYRPSSNRGRINPSGDNTHERNYRQPAAVPESSSAHSGDDVGVWAVGPHAHLFTGTHDQVYLAHAMAYAACVGEGITFCRPNGGGGQTPARNKGQATAAIRNGSQNRKIPQNRQNAQNRRNTQNRPNVAATANVGRTPVTNIANRNANTNNNAGGGVNNANLNNQNRNVSNNNGGNGNVNLGVANNNNPSTGNALRVQRNNNNNVGQRTTARNNNDNLSNNNILRKRSGNTSIAANNNGNNDNNNGVNNQGKSLTPSRTVSGTATNNSGVGISAAASTNVNRGRSRWANRRGRWRGR